MAKIALATAPEQPISDARAALAAQIERHQLAKKELEAIEAALTWDGAAVQAVHRAEAGLEAAQAALEIAKSQAASILVSTGASEPGGEMRKARINVADAKDFLETAQIGRAMIQDRLEPARRHVLLMAMLLQDRAIEVIRDEMMPRSAAIFLEYAALQSRAQSANDALSFLISHRAIDRPPGLQVIQSDHAQPWRDALAALITDPSAPLPS